MSQKKGSRDYSMVSNFYWNNGTGIIIFYFCMKNFKCQHAYLNFMYIYPLLFIILCFLKDISSYRYLFLIQWLISREYDIIGFSVDTDKEVCLVDYKCFFIEAIKHLFYIVDNCYFLHKKATSWYEYYTWLTARAPCPQQTPLPTHISCPDLISCDASQFFFLKNAYFFCVHDFLTLLH